MAPLLDVASCDAGRGSWPRALHGPDDPIEQRYRLTSASKMEVQDLICVGFGPASLAIAVALHDMLEDGSILQTEVKIPKVKFLERQARFGWHAGMLLPGTKMQISFIKDLATLRNPRSKFTFLNYLKEQNRLVQFSNLDTFLPLRVEFEAYLKWVAEHFDHVVDYGQDVIGVRPLHTTKSDKYDCLEITCRNIATGLNTVHLSRNVVIAVGGRPARPTAFSAHLNGVIHSSQYKSTIPLVLPASNQPYNIAVIGGGQSAAEVFNDLHTRYPNAKTQMIFRDTSLRPSDDSPFVNELFDPEAVDGFYDMLPEGRLQSIRANKATNYSVVRLHLLEKIYETLYHQSIYEPNKEEWQHRLRGGRQVTEAKNLTLGNKVKLVLQNLHPSPSERKETLIVDAAILATGYHRDVHNDLLRNCQAINGNGNGQWLPRRDYSVKLNDGLVTKDIGIWLQGCNENTHGLSDSLLSILSVRSGDLVKSIFGSRRDSAENLGAHNTEKFQDDSV